MHASFQKASRLTETIIGAAVEVHRDKGAGLVESIYEWCLVCELELRKQPVTSQRAVRITYKGFSKEEQLRYDVLVGECVLVEVNAVTNVVPVHKAQLLSYMKLLDVPIGLLINFDAQRLTDGVSRLILQGADGELSASSATSCKMG